MKFQLVVMLALFTTVAWGQDRKPAVEDFVGIEVEQPQTTALPQGNEVLFNLEKDMAQVAEGKKASQPLLSQGQTASIFNWDPLTITAVVSLLAMPLISWFWAMNRMKKKAHEQTASNIRVLEQYRREREAKKKDEVVKKVS